MIKNKKKELNDKTTVAIQKNLYFQSASFKDLMALTGKSRGAVNDALKRLEEKGIVWKEKGVRGKWVLAKNGKDRITISGLANQIQSCKVTMEESEQIQATSTFLLMDFVKNEDGQKAVNISDPPDPFKDNFGRASADFFAFSPCLRTHGLNLTSEVVRELARKEGLVDSDEEKLKEKVLEALSKRIKRIVFVEVLEPSLLLEELRKSKEPPEMKEDLTKCSACSSKKIVEKSNGDIVCEDCGFVLGKKTEEPKSFYKEKPQANGKVNKTVEKIQKTSIFYVKDFKDSEK